MDCGFFSFTSSAPPSFLPALPLPPFAAAPPLFFFSPCGDKKGTCFLFGFLVSGF